MPFMVGIYPEISKPSLRETAKVRARKKENWGRIGLRELNPNRMIIPSEFTLMEAEIPCVLNGQITEAKTDAYKFFAKTKSYMDEIDCCLIIEQCRLFQLP